MQSLYGSVLKQSWQTIWRRPYLWFVGILAILFAGSIEIELLENFLNQDRNNFMGVKEFLAGGLFNPDILGRFKDLFASDASSASWALAFVLLFLVVLLIILFISVMAHIVIIDHSAQVKRSSNPVQPKVWASVAKLRHKLLPVVSLNLAIKVFIFIVFTLVTLPIFLTRGQDLSWVNYLYLLLFVILLPVAIIFSFVVKYIISYVIVYGQSLRLAIKNGWRLFAENWLVSIEMSFMLFLLHVLGSLIIIFVVRIIAIPLSVIMVAGSTYSYWFVIISPILFNLIGILLYTIGGGFLVSYLITAWTTLFVRLNEEGGTSKIARTVAKLTNSNN